MAAEQNVIGRKWGINQILLNPGLGSEEILLVTCQIWNITSATLSPVNTLSHMCYMAFVGLSSDIPGDVIPSSGTGA